MYLQLQFSNLELKHRIITFLSTLPPLKFDKGPGLCEFYEKTSEVSGLNFILGASFEVEKRKNAHNAYTEYGAISIPDQQQLSSFLTEALQSGSVSAQMVLDLLKDLSCVHIGYEVIVMIAPKSLAIKILKDLCLKMIEKQTNRK